MRTCCKRRRCCYEAGQPAGFCGAGGAVLSIHSEKSMPSEPVSLFMYCTYVRIMRCCAASRPHPWRLWCVPRLHHPKVVTVEMIVSSGGCLKKSRCVALLNAPHSVRDARENRALRDVFVCCRGVQARHKR